MRRCSAKCIERSNTRSVYMLSPIPAAPLASPARRQVLPLRSLLRLRAGLQVLQGVLQEIIPADVATGSRPGYSTGDSQESA